MPSSRFLTAFAALVLLASAALAHADLDGYVKAPDPSFAFRVEAETPVAGVGTLFTVHVTSQTWQGIPWTHWLFVLRPEKIVYPDVALLVVSGGRVKKDPPKPGAETMFLGQVAARTGAVIAVLSQVPNQPLFGDLKEDALIAHTFVKQMQTGDDTWPALLPMTKSAVRAMDVVQSLLKERFAQDVTRFVVTGGSKRGWTTWLAGAVDARVCAIAPMVIDTLNLRPQMALQVATFGGYSEQIDDYTKIGLQRQAETPAGRKLLDLVDPYTYRARLTMPKLLVMGTNDRYWPVDAANLYFYDLEGEKQIHYVPNAGHGLGPQAVDVVGGFFHSVAAGGTRPRMAWSTTRRASSVRVEAVAGEPPIKAELWQAEAPTRDFRDAKWSPVDVGALPDGRVVVDVAAPADGYRAFYVCLTFRTAEKHALPLCTPVQVLGDKARLVQRPAEPEAK